MTFFYPAVLLAAEPSLYRTGLVALLQEQWPALPLVLTADTTQLIDLVQQQAFQVIILDGVLPGRMLPGLLQRLHQERPSQRMLVLDAGGQPQLTTQPAAPQLLVPRHTAPNRLAATLAPWLGETPCQGKPARSLRPVPTRFSPRELEVLRLVVDDRCNREIADSLYLSVRTIESHRRALLQKSGTRTLVGLVAWALREGMVA
jgi:DNA-binding NarL/FixJ family response regulator